MNEEQLTLEGLEKRWREQASHHAAVITALRAKIDAHAELLSVLLYRLRLRDRDLVQEFVDEVPEIEEDLQKSQEHPAMIAEMRLVRGKTETILVGT